MSSPVSPNEAMPAAASVMLKITNSSPPVRPRRSRRSGALAATSTASRKWALIGSAVRPTQVPRITRSL